MRQLRLEQLSIYYWLTDLLPSFVNIETEYPEVELELPTLSVTVDDIDPDSFELGGKDLIYRAWRIEIFAENFGQRADYADLIMEELEDNVCYVYDFNQGFPPPYPDKLGSLIVVDRGYKPLRVFEDLVKKKYWWGVVTFVTYFQPTV